MFKKTPKPPGEDRSYKVALFCIQHRIYDRPNIEHYVREAYAQGKPRSESYIQGAINRTIENIKKINGN